MTYQNIVFAGKNDVAKYFLLVENEAEKIL